MSSLMSNVGKSELSPNIFGPLSRSTLFCSYYNYMVNFINKICKCEGLIENNKSCSS